MKTPIKIFIDFETQSNNDIRLGVNHYMSCPNFRAYLLSYSVNAKGIKTLTNLKDEGYELSSIIKSGNYLVISHNTNFDVSVWNKIFPDLQIDWAKTLDTSWLCRVLNVPASLEKVCNFFGIEGKYLEGAKILKKYFKSIEIPENDFQEILKYSPQDVKALIKLYEILSTVPSDYVEANQKIYEMVQRQNRIKIDWGTFSKLYDLKNDILTKAELEAKAKFPTYKKSGSKEPVSIARSANEVKKFINSQLDAKISENMFGQELPELPSITTISKNKIEEELNLNGVTLNDRCKELIDLYRVLQSKGLSKYDTFQEYLASQDDSEFFVDYFIRDFQISHGAHTGRPAGRGLQLHNVSRPPKLIENMTSETILRSLKELLEKRQVENFLDASQYLSSLLWACMIPDEKKHVIGRYDLSAIEPRVGAFLRNDLKLLDLYRLADAGKGKDEYTIFGERMNFPKDILRQVSKVIILAACYGMGSAALRASLINAGLPDIGDNEAKRLLSSYHVFNPSVKRSWYEIESKFKLAILTGYAEYNHLEFQRVVINGKKFIAVILPSGRAKFYADCGISSNGKILYNDTRLGKIELRAYLLYENLVQASATDVLFLKCAKVEKLKGVKIKLTIYDELIVSTLPKNVKAIQKIMGENEEAYNNMPLSFKGGESSTFWKGDKV